MVCLMTDKETKICFTCEKDVTDNFYSKVIGSKTNKTRKKEFFCPSCFEDLVRKETSCVSDEIVLEPYARYIT